jgi:hypothetical protein
MSAELANILLQGGKKYNKRNRKKTKKNRKQRKKKAKAKKLQYPDRVALKQERKMQYGGRSILILLPWCP